MTIKQERKTIDILNSTILHFVKYWNILFIMSENQIPKATMANFIRRKIPAKKISADFIHLMMNLSESKQIFTLEYLNILTA